MTLSSLPPAPAVVVTDLDGTLLGADHLVSARNAAALKRAADAGAHVVIATGRPVYNLYPVLEIGFTGIAVCMNGAVTYDIAAGQVKAVTLLEPHVMREFTADLTDAGLQHTLAVERAVDTRRDFWAEEDYLHPWDDVTLQWSTRDEVLGDPAVKMYVRYAHRSLDILAEVREIAAGRVSTTDSSGDGLLEVAAAGITKASALAKLTAEWGVDPAEAVAFGDMPNDIEMLQWAGTSVAMANAHPDVKGAATHVGAHHAADAVAEVLEQWF